MTHNLFYFPKNAVCIKIMSFSVRKILTFSQTTRQTSNTHSGRMKVKSHYQQQESITVMIIEFSAM